MALMDEEELYEIHPLDRDYSSDATANENAASTSRKKFGKPAARASRIAKELPYLPRLRYYGAWGLLGGLLILLLSGIAVSNFRANTLGETLAGFVNRLSMFVMLAGGIAIVVAYRFPAIADSMSGSTVTLSKNKRAFVSLLIYTTIGYLAVVALVSVVPVRGSTLPIYVFNGLGTLLFALMITLAVFYDGPVRAFGIAVTAGLYFNFQITGWIVYNSFGTGAGDLRLAMLINLAIILTSGLVCAAVVTWKTTQQTMQSPNSQSTHQDGS
ncbi:hypothetical protein [Planctomycetes bacterium K23_9]